MSSLHDGLRVGFLGAGRWSALWADAVRASDRFELTGAVEPNAAVAEAFRQRFRITPAAAVDSLVASGTNLWLVGTPTASHLRDVRAIVAATEGPAIIVVASPVALDPGQVSEMERLEDARVRIVPAHELRYGAPAWLRGRMPRLGAIEAIEARYEMPAMPGTLPLSAVDVGLSGGGVGMELMPDLLDLILFLGGGRPLWVAAKAHRRRMGAQRRQAETGLTAYCPWYFDNLTDPGSVSAATYWGDEVRLEVDVHGTEGSGRLMGRADGLGFVLRAGTVTGSDHPAGVGGGAPLLWTARAASRVLLLRDTGNLLSDRLAGREAAPNRLPTLGPPGQGLALIGEMYRAAATTPPAMLRVTTNTPA